MTFSLHIWDRNDGSYARRDADSVSALREAWGVKWPKALLGVIALSHEPEPEMPSKAQTVFRRLLATPAVGEWYGDSIKVAVNSAHPGSDLIAVIGFSGPPAILMRERAAFRAEREARLRSVPIFREDYPGWFKSTSLASVFGQEACAGFAEIGVETVGDLGGVDRATFERAGLGGVEDVAAIRTVLRAAFEEASLSLAREVAATDPGIPERLPGEDDEGTEPAILAP